MAEEQPAEITLVDEGGVERRFRLHDVFDFEDAAYYLVESVDDPEQVLLLRERDGTLETVEGEEFDQVMAALQND